jgi:hypothetical protein
MATTSLAPARVPQLSRLQTLGLGAAVIGIALLAVGYFVVGPDQFCRSYLFGFYFAMSFALSSLGFLLLQHLTGGAWGVTVRRMLEAGALAMPVMALLFVPIVLATFPSTMGILGLTHPLYQWADPALVTPSSPTYDPGIAHKLPWLTPEFFAIRGAIYFIVWSSLALILRSWSIQQDRTGSEVMRARMRMISGIGLALFVISISFAAFDWTMSLDPHWFSSMYGVQYMVSSGLTMLAFLILMFTQIEGTEIFKAHVSIKPIHDIAKLMLGFTVLWTYVTYMQYNIIWSGDLAESTPWFVVRTHGGWLTVVPILMVFQFFLPFFLLLSRRRKQSVSTVAPIAALIIIMRFVDLSWIVLPSFHESITQVNWTEFAAPVGLAGIWLAVFAWNLQRAALLPLNDPNMEWLHAGGAH